MMKSIYVIILLLCSVTYSVAQDLNSYQYVIVPNEFSFQKEPGQYQLNELTKFLLEKQGFQAFLEGEDLPQNVNPRGCETLRAQVKDDSNMFRTKLQLELRDCNNRQVFISETGISREKEFEKGFQEALRNAFKSLEDVNYQYSGAENVVEVTAIPPKQDEMVQGEVEKDLPEEQMAEEKPATKTEIVKEDAREQNLVFTRENSVYFLEKTQRGYNFFQEGMAEPFAALVKTSGGDSYLYSSVTNKGMARLDEKGDLVVEILDPETGDLNTIIYKKQLQ